MIRSGQEDPVAKALMEALGCPKNVRSFRYEAAVDQVSCVTVEYYPEIGDGAGLALEAVTRKFYLRAIPDEPWPFDIQAEHVPMTRARLEELRVERDLRIAAGAPHGTEWRGG